MKKTRLNSKLDLWGANYINEMIDKGTVEIVQMEYSGHDTAYIVEYVEKKKD